MLMCILSFFVWTYFSIKNFFIKVSKNLFHTSENIISCDAFYDDKKNNVSINYKFENKKYSIIVQTPSRDIMKKPLNIISILDNKDNDVLNHVLEFRGPNNDFHKMKITPNDIGYKSLSIVKMDENNRIVEYTVNESEEINL